MIQVWTINILVMPSRGHTEKSKNGQEHHRTKEQKDQNQGGQNPPKMRKYFKTPTIKVYDPMITWYRCGQSTFSSCHHVATQKKAKMDKSTTGRKPQRIRIKADKRSHDHMIQVWTINILVMPSRVRTEKSKNGKYFKTLTINVYNPMITWYRCGQSTFSSCHHVAAQRKAKMDQSTTGQKPQRIRIKVDKTPKNEKIF